MSGGSLEPQCLVCRPVLSMRIPVLAAAMVTASHLVAWPKTTKTKTQDVVLWATERGRRALHQAESQPLHPTDDGLLTAASLFLQRTT